MTGQSAVLGMDSAVAAEIAVEEINTAGGVAGKKIKLILEDDQYDAKKTVSAYQKLVDVDGAKVIVISTYSGVFVLAERAKQDGVVLVDPLDCNSELAALGDHVFCLATDSESIAEILAEETEKSEVKKVGVLFFQSDAFMPLVKDVFVSEFGGKVILVEGYSAGTSDFRTSISKMMEQDVEAMVLLGYDETGFTMKQARTLGFEGQFYTTGTVTSPSLQKASAGNSEGTIFAFWDAQKDREPAMSFTAKFIEKQGRPAILDLATYPTYDAVKVIAKALESNDLKQGLLDIQGFAGATGNVSFSSDGTVRIRESAFVLHDGFPVKA